MKVTNNADSADGKKRRRWFTTLYFKQNKEKIMFYKYPLFVKQLVKKAKMIFILLPLLTFIPSLSLADENEAYEQKKYWSRRVLKWKIR